MESDILRCTADNHRNVSGMTAASACARIGNDRPIVGEPYKGGSEKCGGGSAVNQIIGGVDGGDRSGRRHIAIDPQLLAEAATGAEQTGARLREMIESAISRHEVSLRT